jgi:hypothetical protein
VFAQAVRFSDDSMTVLLDDGRALSVPVTWYPRLLEGSEQEREHYELIGMGEGIHWPDLDEDISVEGPVRLSCRPPLVVEAGRSAHDVGPPQRSLWIWAEQELRFACQNTAM